MIESIVISRLEPDAQRPSFECTDDDLNEYFHVDSVKDGLHLLSVTYTVSLDGDVVGFFSVSNDSVRKEDLPSGRKNRFLRLLPWGKRKQYASLPTVKIGRLAVGRGLQGQGVGTAIMDFLKMFFTHKNKTGCRFLVVDAYNQEDVLKFYQNNGFEFLLNDDMSEKTRLMFFDLHQFVSAAAE